MLSTLSTEDAALVAGADLFKGADLDLLAIYFETCEQKTLQAEEVLLSPSLDNQHIYILLSGCLNIHLDSLKTTPLNQVYPGACVGEVSIIDQQDPSAFVVATTTSRVLLIPQRTVWSMIDVSHMVAKNLLYILASRLRHGHGVIMNGLEMQNQLQHHAMLDGLTGLHNRRWFDDALQRKVERSQAENQPLCLLLMDIDHFKSVNDKYGHLAGDSVIVEVAQALSRHIRSGDMPARFGGDEFVVILPNTTLSAALVIAERLRTHVNALNLVLDGQELPPISVSLGIAEHQAEEDVSSLFKRADAGLYDAKNRGRNCSGYI